MGFWGDLWKSPASWLVPGKGVYDIFKGLTGGGQKGQAPDMSFYEGWGEYPTEAVQQGEKAIRGQTTQWLEDAMRGYRGEAAGRGWSPQTSGGNIEFGDRASGVASQNMSTALANLYQWGAGQEQAGDIRGKEAYTQMLMNYQNQMGGQDNSNWIAQLMQYLPMML